MYYWGREETFCQFRSEEKRKARKEHKCYECGGTILVDGFYKHFAGKWDDEFSAWNVCIGCADDWDKIMQIFYNNGENRAIVIFGLLSEAIHDAVDKKYLEIHASLAQKWLVAQEKDPEEAVALSQMRKYSRALF